ncbi:MAG: DUF6427 family protein [Cyclobacteriaceae bacterium]|nr:DUF6427 family protein [Cyclobacteriaceae bacterium]
MLRFFRVNDPYRLLTILVIFILLALPFLIADNGFSKTALFAIVLGQKMHEGFTPYITLLDNTPILSLWLQGLMYTMAAKSSWARELFALAALFFQGAYLAIVFIQKKAFEENTYLPALLFVVLCLISADLFTITPTLLASGFLLLALNSLIKEIEFKNYQDDQVLITGFYLALATLSENTFIVYFAGTWLVLILFTRLTARKHIVYVVGFLLPHFILLTVYWFTGNNQQLLTSYYGYFFTKTKVLLTWSDMLLTAAIPVFFLLISFFRLTGGSRLTNYQSQLFQVMLLWLVFGIGYLALASDLRPQCLLPMFPPLCYLMAHFLLTIQRRRWAEIFLWLIMAGLPAYSYLQQKGMLSFINNADIYVKTDTEKKRVRALVLTEDNSLGITYEPATGLMNGRQKTDLFTETPTYASVTMLAAQLTLGKPQVIEDPQNRLQNYWQHLPNWKKRYQKKGNRYYLLP